MNDMSLKAKIRNISSEKNISAAAVLQNYLISRFLFRMADSKSVNYGFESPVAHHKGLS